MFRCAAGQRWGLVVEKHFFWSCAATVLQIRGKDSVDHAMLQTGPVRSDLSGALPQGCAVD